MDGGSDLLPIVLFTGVGTDGGHPWPAPGEWWPIPGPGSDFRKMSQCRESATSETNRISVDEAARPGLSRDFD